MDARLVLALALERAAVRAKRLGRLLQQLVAAAKVEERIGVGRLQLCCGAKVLCRLAVPLLLSHDHAELVVVERAGQQREAVPVVADGGRLVGVLTCNGQIKPAGGRPWAGADRLRVAALRLRLPTIALELVAELAQLRDVGLLAVEGAARVQLSRHGRLLALLRRAALHEQRCEEQCAPTACGRRRHMYVIAVEC